jgi:trans-2,3-dihydro-3-hydroxyanthranilate isomerase
LAVFTDARGLTDKQMQALAREMNLSETTFILPRKPEVEATDGRRVRIFSTREELPFAGHPKLGTALYLSIYIVRLIKGSVTAQKCSNSLALA